MVIRQLIAGVSPVWLLILPLPVPDVLLILMVNGPLRNLAWTVRSALISVRQVPVPLQVWSHPTKECPGFGVAVSVTVVVLLNCALHPVLPATPVVMVQLIPLGLEVTTPLPVPLPVTVRVLRITASEELASTG